MGKDDGERFAPDGMVWICIACGKISPNDRYGNKDSSPNWDEACIINSILIREENIVKSKDGKRVVEIKKDEISI